MSRPITTIITPAVNTDLVTLARVKSELGITDDSTDELLGEWITEESGTVTDYLRRVLAQEKVSDEFRLCGDNNERLSLTRRPIVSIDSVVECDVPLETTEYEIDPGAGIIYRLLSDFRIPWWRRKVIVTYTAGYALPASAPSWATKATIICLTHRWAAKGRDPALKEINIPGVIGKQFWVGSIGENGALPPGVEDLLSPHRDVSV